MTLRRQFSIFLSTLVMVLLSGTLVFAILSAKEHYQDQLNTSAYDAATTLALSMTNADTESERERQMDVLFDRGFYSEIRFESTSGTKLVKQVDRTLNNSAPGWFISIIKFDLYPANADVTDGWLRLGTIFVTSHPDFAYRGIWQLAKVEIIWFCGVLLISLILVNLLVGWLFRPIESVEQQAVAICEKKWITQENLPKVRELRNLVQAMNRMVNKVHSMFAEQVEATERIRKDAFTDSVTGLLNRRGFDQKLGQLLDSSEEHSLMLSIIHVKDFSEFNKINGRKQADEFLKEFSDVLKKWCANYSGSILGRHSGVDFALTLGSTDQIYSNQLTKDLFDFLRAESIVRKYKIEFCIGSVFLDQNTRNLPSAFSKADQALKEVQLQSSSGYRLFQTSSDDQNEGYSATEWKVVLEEVLSGQGVDMVYMPTLNNRGQIIAYEVYSRITHRGQVLPAARFWPMVEFHGLSAQFDLHIIRKVVESNVNMKLSPSCRIAINLSPLSLPSNSFIAEVKSILKKSSISPSSFSFELPEHCISRYESELRMFIDSMRGGKVLVGIDQVGIGGVPFSYMKRLGIDYLKIDGSLNRGITEASDTRFYTQFLIQMGHQLDLNVYADGVEAMEDKETLEDISINGVSGYIHGIPLNRIE